MSTIGNLSVKSARLALIVLNQSPDVLLYFSYRLILGWKGGEGGHGTFRW